MNLLVPAALGLASLVAPLLVLYMLRSKRRQVEVPSTMLWERVGESVSSAVPWQRLNWTALLLVQLLVLALFVLSLTRPFATERALLGPHTVLVIDTSGSMATAGRLDAAVSRARSLAQDASATNLVSVVSAGPEPEVLAAFTRTPEAVDDALDRVQASGGPSRLDDAVALARGLATPDRPSSLLIFSDGGSAPLATEPLVDATHLLFDAADEDVSIDAFAPDDAGEGLVRGFVTVANHGAGDRLVTLVVSVNDLPSGSTDLQVPAGSSTNELIPIDAVPGDVVSVRIAGIDGPAERGLDSQPDANRLDDQAWFVLGTGPERGVSTLGKGSSFLAALIAVTPGFGPTDGLADLLIVDGGPLPEIDRPAWIIRPESPPDGLTVTEVVRNVVATSQRPGEPILDGVDMSTLAVAEAQVVETNSWTPIISAGDVPLLLLGEVNGQRAAYTTFDLTHSTFPVDVAFPVVGSRLLHWLAGSTAGAVSVGLAGDPIPVAPPPGAMSIVSTPDGSTRELPSVSGVFTATGTPGVYRVRYRLGDGALEDGPVAVRAFDSREAAATPRQISVASDSSSTQDETTIVREIAPWVVGAALLLMAIEWWLGHQRPRLWRRRETVLP